jgi:SAM-dependent methyltransferase
MKMEILKSVNDYYSNKVKQFGATPSGVDWNSIESQETRYEILLKVMNEQLPGISLLDFGCGYGGLLEYCLKKKLQVAYTGYDISESMIEAAQKKFNAIDNIVWTTEIPSHKYDFVVASGIFNVRLNTSETDWHSYMIETINKMNALSIKGFSFNVLTSYADVEYMKDYLYYANPTLLFDYCKKQFSKNVALLHDYNLYEFTIIVRK